MLGTHDKTLCGWNVTVGELTQLKKMDSKYVNCKRCIEKLDDFSNVLPLDLNIKKNTGNISNV